MNEGDVIVLLDDIREHGLQKGDVGTVIHSHAGAAAIEAEFMNAAGETIAVLTLPANTIRLIEGDEIPHARRLMPQ